LDIYVPRKARMLKLLAFCSIWLDR
jgi:hypothetical protein